MKRYINMCSGWMAAETPLDPLKTERWVKAKDAARLLSAGEALAEVVDDLRLQLERAGYMDPGREAHRERIEDVDAALSVWHETVKAVGEGTENEEAPKP